MKRFSILLPTHNRLDLLKYAVETVRNQDFSDWEIVISDNFSTENIQEFVQSLNDDRIIYSRTVGFVSVTENWNLALSKSSGEYVIMLGDDDGLLKGSLSKLDQLIQKFASPDFIFSNAIQFAYPNVFPCEPRGFIQRGYTSFFTENRSEPWLLFSKAAKGFVEKSFNFRLPSVYNMQHSIIHRRMIEKISRNGSFFDSPYPDYFATNALFLEATRILVNPTPLVMIGVSPKSFGFFYLNGKESTGNTMLNNALSAELAKKLSKVILPGSEMNTSWLAAMELVQSRFGSKHGLRVNYRRYRIVQVLETIKKEGTDRAVLFMSFLTPLDRRLLKAYLAVSRWLTEFAPGLEARNQISACFKHYWNPHPAYDSQRQTVECKNLLEAHLTLDPTDPKLARPLKVLKPEHNLAALLSKVAWNRVQIFFAQIFRKESTFSIISPVDWEPMRKLNVQVRVIGRAVPLTAMVRDLEKGANVCEFPVTETGKKGTFAGSPGQTLVPGNYVVVVTSTKSPGQAARGIKILPETNV